MAAGGPEHLRIILEGESLLNDASSFTLFTIFIDFVVKANEDNGVLHASAGAIIWKIIWKMVWLATGAFEVAKRFMNCCIFQSTPNMGFGFVDSSKHPILAGGALIGLAFGISTRWLLRFLQRWGASAEQQIALTLAAGYLVFYTANSPAAVSGELPQTILCLMCL